MIRTSSASAAGPRSHRLQAVRARAWGFDVVPGGVVDTGSGACYDRGGAFGPKRFLNNGAP